MLEGKFEQSDLIKLLLYIFAFLLISMIIMFALIVPSVKEFKIEKSKYGKYEAAHNAAREKLEEKQTELKELKNKNAKILNAFAKKFDDQKLLDGANKFFQKSSIVRISKEIHEESFSRYELNVTTDMSTPTKFYEFIDYLNKFDNIAQIDFPIIMEGTNQTINGNFSIKVYELDSVQKIKQKKEE